MTYPLLDIDVMRQNEDLQRRYRSSYAVATLCASLLSDSSALDLRWDVQIQYM